MTPAAKQEYLLLDTPKNPTRARVDNVTLTRGGDPQSLTASQVDRLRETGVQVRATTNDKE